MNWTDHTDPSPLAPSGSSQGCPSAARLEECNSAVTSPDSVWSRQSSASNTRKGWHIVSAREGWTAIPHGKQSIESKVTESQNSIDFVTVSEQKMNNRLTGRVETIQSIFHRLLQKCVQDTFSQGDLFLVSS
jgi:hypothetical protein